MRETFEEADAKKGVDVLAESGGEVRISRNWTQFRIFGTNFYTSGLVLTTVSKNPELKKSYVKELSRYSFIGPTPNMIAPFNETKSTNQSALHYIHERFKI